MLLTQVGGDSEALCQERASKPLGSEPSRTQWPVDRCPSKPIGVGSRSSTLHALQCCENARCRDSWGCCLPHLPGPFDQGGICQGARKRASMAMIRSSWSQDKPVTSTPKSTLGLTRGVQIL